MTLLFLIALISIGFSFLCSVWEAVLLSMPASFVEIKLAEGHATGKVLKRLKDDIDKPLSAILSLNTLAHTVGAILVGAQAHGAFGEENIQIAGYELPLSPEAIVAAVMTLAILILSEIIPKTIGATYWRRLSGFTASSLRYVMIGMWPLVALSQFITRKLKGGSHEHIVSRADFSAMAEIGQREGVFNPGESKIIGNLMRFHLIKARSIMTPRTVVKAANQALTVQEFYDRNRELPFSRIPIFQDSKDHITGFILKDVVLEQLVHQQGDTLLSDIGRSITIVEEDQSIQDVLNTLLGKREQIALVVDTFGGMAGIVTLEDVFETLLGLEIVDELDSVEDMQILARQNWEKRAKKLGLIEEEMGNEEPTSGQEE
ncbi:MAG: HlyC/CorC family transporter [Lewinella sp.]|nr:HlyC/CorC family transporter [Lewinella sp.]